jgi:hypothetical protein
MTSIRQAAGRCMDLVRLEDAVEMSIIFAIEFVAEVGSVVAPERSRVDVPPSFERDEIQIHRGTCSARCGTLLVGLTIFFLTCSRSCSFPSSFTTATSSVNLLPSVYNVREQQNWRFCFVRTIGGTFAETQEKSLGDRALR